MQANLHRLESGEPDGEALLLGASAGLGISGFAWLACGLPVPPCAFHAITGCPCPTCGATRCAIAILHGNFAQAAGWNPMVFTALVAIALLNLYAGVTLLGGLSRIRFALTGAEARFVRILAAALVAANWAYEIHRGV